MNIDPLTRNLLGLAVPVVTGAFAALSCIIQVARILGRPHVTAPNGGPTLVQQRLFGSIAECAALALPVFPLMMGAAEGAVAAAAFGFVGWAAGGAARPRPGFRSPGAVSAAGIIALGVSIASVCLSCKSAQSRIPLDRLLFAGIEGMGVPLVLGVFVSIGAPIALLELTRRPSSGDHRIAGPTIGYVVRCVIAYSLGTIEYWALTGPAADLRY